MSRLFTAERAGMLAVIALILFIAALAMCSRMGGDHDGENSLAPDSALVQQADSAIHAARVDTVPAKTPTTMRRKKENKPRVRQKPFSRQHLRERVDTLPLQKVDNSATLKK